MCAKPSRFSCLLCALKIELNCSGSGVQGFRGYFSNRIVTPFEFVMRQCALYAALLSPLILNFGTHTHTHGNKSSIASQTHTEADRQDIKMQALTETYPNMFELDAFS